MDPRSLPVSRRVQLLVKALNGAERTNEALARCSDGDGMVMVLVDASNKLGLGLSREDLLKTPPIRDWIWWKNKEALLTIGDEQPRYQQDGRQQRERQRQQDESPDSVGTDPPRKRFLGLF
ncbi:hypothetical protein [Cyanobium sp. Morenito 9A2]|uniref:hypothetical protein n=1 Tax=Cyanobium sp. Morenito 9A2 TaxID=2823718 RepID=UPI0020CFCF7D|nr:hypothetical protein [Cyanobium sp. Morenito 9A2]MCP9849003.1 hypothetical protein [Cyanobium sp. Morenito 9A2]